MRSATIKDPGPQLTNDGGYRIYLFDGLHYLPDTLVAEITAGQATLSTSSATKQFGAENVIA